MDEKERRLSESMSRFHGRNGAIAWGYMYVGRSCSRQLVGTHHFTVDRGFMDEKERQLSGRKKPVLLAAFLLR